MITLFEVQRVTPRQTEFSCEDHELHMYLDSQGEDGKRGLIHTLALAIHRVEETWRNMATAPKPGAAS